MTRVGLTAQQSKLFTYIEMHLNAGRPSPSYDEMVVFMGLRSKSGVKRIVDALVERGWLVTMPNRARALALPPSAAADEVRAILTEREVAREAAQTATLRISVPQGFARQLADFCARQHRIPSDVILEAVSAHMRGRA